MRPHEAEMIKKGEEVKVDARDKEAFEEVQKIVESQEQKIKEETEGATPLSAVSWRYQYLTKMFGSLLVSDPCVTFFFISAV